MTRPGASIADARVAARVGAATAPPRAQPRRTPPRTLWQEGRWPGPLVAALAVLAGLAAARAAVWATGGVGVLFDALFVLVCLGAALAVRPRDFFAVGVLPPLLMAGLAAVLAGLDRDLVADPRDGPVQAVVSGLAHHAGALVAGYGLALGVLAVRQVAVRRAGALRR